MKTGTGPWDDNDEAGNDSSEDNNIVRSFDQVTYTIESTMALKDTAIVQNFKGGIIKIEAVLPDECKNVMSWDLDSMGWTEGSGVVSDNGMKLTAEYRMGQNDVTIPGKQNIVLVLAVQGATNNTEIIPDIELWLEGNDEIDKVQVTNVQTVKVSAAPNYNVALSNNIELKKEIEYKDGNETKKGRLYGYGINYQLYNNQSDKGLKGIEYPAGDINLDVEMTLTKTNMKDTSDVQDITSTTTPFLYNYKLNYYDTNTGILPDRDMNVTWHAAHEWRLPAAKRGSTTDKELLDRYCYDSGDVSMSQSNNIISVNVKNYKFDGTFPTLGAGDSLTATRRYGANQGCFSTVYFQVLVPFTDETTEGEYNYYLKVEAKDFSVTSKSGTEVNSEMSLNDNTSTISHVIYYPGDFMPYNWLNSNWADKGYQGLHSYWTLGDARAYVGQKFIDRYDFGLDPNIDERDNVYSANVLMKFDGEAFNITELNGRSGGMADGWATNATLPSDMKFNMLYAAKKDGTNWLSDDEMKQLVESDLLYYKSLDDMKAELGSDAICVGVLFESQSGTVGYSAGCRFQVALQTTNKAEIGKVYQFFGESNLYRKDNQLDRTMYTRLNRNIEFPKADVLLKNNYIKTAYDESGNIIEGTHNGGYKYGQSLLIVGGKVSVANEVNDKVSDGSNKINYDIGRNEYEVNYKLSPVLSTEGYNNVSISNITLKVSDTLPVGLNYVPGSSNYDEPDVMRNDDGTTTLVWEIYNCVTNVAIDPITFKAKIDEETVNGKQLETVAVVEADKIGTSLPNTRTAKRTIQVTNLSSYSLYKTTQTPIIELNGLIHYRITCINKTEDSINDFQLLDILPYNGDNRGTKYNGTYTVKNISINVKNSSGAVVNDSDLKLYVSNEESAKSADAKDENLGLDDGWKELAENTEYNGALTAYALVGEIGGRNRLEVDVYLQTNGNKPMDMYKNSATAQIDKNTEKMETSIILVQDIKRSIEGTIWFDSNKNGVMDENEEKLENVEVELIQDDGNQAVDIDGNKINNVLTDSNGHYEFEDMVRGNYKVKVNFTDDEKEITIKNIGGNKEINSKFNTDKMTDSIETLDTIDVPIIAEKYVNAGITYKDTSVLVRHYIKGTTTKLSEDVTVNGKISDEYTTNVASDIPEQYELVETPTNATGTMTKNQIVVTYYYQLKNYPYTVNYLEKDTNKVLHTAKQGDELVYGSTVTSSKEVIEIDGYKYDSIDKDSLTITTGENVINIYYTKRTDLSYTVNYLEKGTDKVLHDQKVQNKMIFDATVDSADEVIDIDGYKYDSADKTSIKITTGENVINIYYTKVNGLSYIVNYLEKGTNEVINPAKTKDGMTFQDVVTSRDEIISIDGYDYDSVDKDTLTITTGENAINIYYTKRNDLSYIVNYLEKGTNKVLHDQKVQNNMTFESVVTSANEVIAIDGYNYNSVDKETLTIGTKENIINIYYIKRNDLSYKVNYLEKTTNKVLHDQKVQDGMTFESVVTSANEVIDINGYNYDSVDKDTLTITTGENVINIYYTKRNDLSYKVNYLEKTTNKVLHDQKIQEGMTFESVVNSSDEVIDIDGYNYDSVDKDTLTIITGENVINIYYTKRNDLSYIVNYLEKDTNIVLHEPKVTENMILESTVTSSKEVIDIDGYNYDSVDKEALVIGTGENVINIYYTKRNDLSYTVNYLEKGTNRTIHTPKVTQNMTFGTEITSSKEVIPINGYSYDLVDKDNLIITTGENVINIYYTKVSGLSYTVNYLEKDTDEVLQAPKTTGDMIFEYEIISSDEVIGIDGYNYDSVDKDKLIIGTGENVINIYYTKRNDLSYKVNYLEKDTNKVLHEPKITENMTFESVVNSSNEVIDIDGYNYNSVDKDSLTITTGENVINVYYTKRSDLRYTVNYLEKDTNKVLHEPKITENMTFESVVNSADEVIDIYGYNYDSVDKDTLTITTGENVINIYYTKKDTKVTVHYYEEGTTNKVSEDVEIPGKVFDDYTTSSADDVPSKYELVAEPENKNGTMTEDEITVIYYYRKKATKVIVHYYEENTTKKLSEDVNINGRVDDKYTTISVTDIPIKYELVATPSNASGSMTEATVEVIYYYRVKEAVVHVRYLEKGTNKVLADQDRIDGKVDDDYQTTPKVIDGYQLVEHTGNEKGKFEVEPLTITYYYLYKTKATVQYIDKITGQILEQSTTEGLEGDDFITESKDFENYVLVEEPAEKTVKMTKEEQVLKYYYIHVSGGVIEKHIDVISGQILANKTYEGNEGDAYDIPSRTFDGYDLVEDRLPSNAKGTMKVEPVEVIYYYIYRSKVTAEYIDKNTGEKLTDDVTQNGHEGDNYTTDRKTFDDYKLVEVPANADGSMTKEDIKVTYYYVHTSGGVIVNHIDIKTGKQLLDETKEEGYEGDPYETHEENIPEYDLVKEKYPENATGKMTIEPTRVTYYYIKKTEVNVKYVDKETGEEIDEPTNIPGHEGDDYTTEPKDVPGYDLVEEPENKDGTMTANPTEVIYYYKRPAKVIVNYYDIDTKEKLADEIEITGHQNDDYTTEQKDIKYYEIAKIPENKEGKMIVTVTKDENGKDIVENTTYVNYYYRKLIFNLRVDKTIASVIVNGQETPINGSLGKVEVHRKDISTANVKVVYKIKVTNDSELSGKANVVENIPSGMTMIADNNPEWTINETTASIETDEIKPGESREYQVVLGWQNGDNNIGTKENIASIITENEAGFDEKDKSDNESKADLIVAVGTGEVPYVAIAGSILMITIATTAGIYVIKKKHQ